MWEREVTKFLQLIKLFFVVDCSDYRETAFIYAITSAGATFSVTRACRMGQLSNCGCRKPKRKVAASSQVLTNNLIATQPRNVYPARDNMNNLPNQVFPGENNEFEWGGCSDNIHYGYTISKQLMAKNRGKDGRSMVIEHNNEAGRLVSSAFPRCTKYCFDLPKPFLLVLISTRQSSPPLLITILHLNRLCSYIRINQTKLNRACGQRRYQRHSSEQGLLWKGCETIVLQLSLSNKLVYS